MFSTPKRHFYVAPYEKIEKKNIFFENLELIF